MNIQADCRWTPAQWYNAQDYEVSYKRMYKSASSTIVDLRGIHSFSAYLEYTWKEGYFNKHQFPQAFWIPECEIRIFRLDQLDEVCTYIGVDSGQIKHINARDQIIGVNYADLEIILELYRDDFELFKTAHHQNCSQMAPD